jgi:hypothetical protein
MALTALLLVACRPEVEGSWEGAVSGHPARLNLEQGGSVVEGEMCEYLPALGDDACAELSRGLLEDDRLTLRYGCGTDDCRLPKTTLELRLSQGGDHLDGIGWREGCGCADGGCDCSVDAYFDAL